MNEQEQYLEHTPFKDTLSRGLNKFITELTSIKTLLLAFVCIGIWYKVIDSTTGLGTSLILVGIREIPVDKIMDIFSKKDK